MAKTITIKDNRTGGYLVVRSPRKNSKVVEFNLYLDSYGCSIFVEKQKLREVLEE